MSSLIATGLRYRFAGIVALLVVLAAGLAFFGIFGAKTSAASGASSPVSAIDPSAVSSQVVPYQPGPATDSDSLSPSSLAQAPEAMVNPFNAILGKARRFAVFHGIETGHPSQTWKFEKAYLWGDIGIGPGVRTDFGSDSTLIGDCYQQSGQAAGKGCVSIKPHNGSPPHVEPTYVDYSKDLAQFVVDIRAAITYVDGLTATRTLERITGGATITSASCGSLNVIRVTREVNVGGANHGMTIQGCPTDYFIFNVGGQWASSGGRVRLSGGVPASNVLWVFKGRLQNSGNGGWAGTAIFDTADGADNAGKDMNCFDCALLVLNGKLNISGGASLRWHPFTVFDYGDAPRRYGTLFDAQKGVARHKYTPSGPRLGSAWTGETNGQPTAAANGDSDDGITVVIPPIQAGSTDSLELTVNATNPGVEAKLVCWIDFNRDGDFLDSGERADTVVAAKLTNPSPVKLTFTGIDDLRKGRSFLRCRISTNQDILNNPVTPIPPAAPTPGSKNPVFPLLKSSYQLNDGWPDGEVEEYKVDIVSSEDPGPDYGDAPDTGPGTSQGNYSTLYSDLGPRHWIVDQLFLGVQEPDLEFGTLQNQGATADDGNAWDDEDGIPTMPALSTRSTSVQLNVMATNWTDQPATLRCWIDFNRNGTFSDAGEASSLAAVGVNSDTTTYAITFGGFTAPTAGDSYIRCRIAHDPVQLQQQVASSGEIEDHFVVIAP